MSGLQIYRENGDLLIDVDTSVALPLGVVNVGGANQAQSGEFYDDRLWLGRPFSLVTSIEVNSFIGYRPLVRIAGNKVTWTWPPQYGALPYPKARFIYGLK